MAYFLKKKRNFLVLVSFAFLCSCSLGAKKDLKELNWQVGKEINPSLYTQNSASYGAFLAGLHAKIRNDLSSAAKFYEKAVEKDPDNQILLRNAYTLLVSQGEIEEAYKYAKKLIEKKPTEGMPSLVVASYYAKQKDYKKARNVLQKGFSSQYAKFFLPLMESWLEVGLGDSKKALKTLEKLKENEQLDSFYNFHAGLINDINGNTKKAEEHFVKALSGVNGRSLRAIQIIGNFYRRHSMGEKAKDLIAEFKSLHPDSLTIDNIYKRFNQPLVKKAYVENANDGLSEAMFSIAATMNYGVGSDLSLLFTQLSIYLKKDFDLAHVLLGEILEQRGRHEKALKAYEQISKESDSYLSALLKKALNYSELKQNKKALKLLKEATQKNDKLYSAYSDMGDIYRLEEEYEKAAQAYTKAIDKIKNLKSRHWVLFYARGISFERIKEYEKSEKDFIKALTLEPDQPLVLNYLGYSWLENNKNIKKALEMLEKAYKQRPQDGYITDSLGWAYFLSGKYEKALEYLEEAVSLEPGNSVINDHLGDVYWKVGRKTEAKYSWQKAISLNSDIDEDDIKYIKEKIQRGYFKRKEK